MTRAHAQPVQSACRSENVSDDVTDVTHVQRTPAAGEAPARCDDKTRKRTWTRRELTRRHVDVTFAPDETPPRPMRRAECVDGPRPCPWLSCRHHLALDANPSGSLTVHAPIGDDGELALEAMADTCSLDVADRGDHTLEEVGEVLGVVRERVRQIVDVAIERLRRRRGADRLEVA